MVLVIPAVLVISLLVILLLVVLLLVVLLLVFLVAVLLGRGTETVFGVGGVHLVRPGFVPVAVEVPPARGLIPDADKQLAHQHPRGQGIHFGVRGQIVLEDVEHAWCEHHVIVVYHAQDPASPSQPPFLDCVRKVTGFEPGEVRRLATPRSAHGDERGVVRQGEREEPPGPSAPASSNLLQFHLELLPHLSAHAIVPAKE